MVETAALLVALRQLQAFFTPEPLDLLVIDLPAFEPQQLGDFSIAIAAILFGQPDQRQAQGLIIILAFTGLILLRRARHADRPAGAPLGCVELLAYMDHGLAQVSRLQALGFR